MANEGDVMARELVVCYGTKFVETDGVYYCNGSFGRFVDSLAKKYSRIILLVPVSRLGKNVNVNDYRIKSENIIIQGLPQFESYITALIKRFAIHSAIRKFSKQWKSPVYIRHPNPCTRYLYGIAKNKGLPVCLHLVGDTKSVLVQGTKYRSFVRKLTVLYVDNQDRHIQKIIRNTPTLVNGNGLRRLYDKNNTNIREIRTSTFSEDEIIRHKPNIRQDSLALLYVGYLRHEKGLYYLLDAMKMLKENMDNVKLTIVGDGNILRDLKLRAHELNISDCVKFEGHVPIGERLFSVYREHDIFILPSISEGTPRVLLEAMCNGLAVIATNVGGIPFTLQHKYNGLLINSKSPSEIVKAVYELAVNTKLRSTLIQNGLEFARKNTIESHVQEVYDFIEDKCKMS